MSFHDTWEERLLNLFFQYEPFADHGRYLALGDDINDNTDPLLTLEPSLINTGYYRIPLMEHYWSTPTQGYIENIVQLGWNLALSDWGIFSCFMIMTKSAYAEAGDSILCYGLLQRSIEIVEGSQPKFKPGELKLLLE